MFAVWSKVTYLLDMRLSIKGKEIFSPRAILRAASTATMTLESSGPSTTRHYRALSQYYESANAPLIVLLQFTIRLMDEDGTVVEEYQLAFRGPEGRTMTLSEFDENGGEVISLTVISTKQKL